MKLWTKKTKKPKAGKETGWINTKMIEKRLGGLYERERGRRKQNA